MADITIWGGRYSDAKGVDLPKTGGGTARFMDTSPTTAIASDVASGKIFFLADGTQSTGTSSGGGSTDLVLGVIRPDAELVHQVKYDKHVVSDLGKTIPAYKTARETFVASETLSPTIPLDYSTYDYYVVCRGLAIPEYATGTAYGKGRQEYAVQLGLYDLTFLPAGTYRSQRQGYSASAYNVVTPTTRIIYLYWSSSSALTVTGGTSGAQTILTAPTRTASGQSGQLTLKTPQLTLAGSSSYMTSTYYNALSDIRYQYIIDVWRAPKGNLNLDGWGAAQLDKHVADCYANGGTLT